MSMTTHPRAKLGRTCTTISASHCDAVAKKASAAFALGTDLVELRIDMLLRVSSAAVVKKLSHLRKKSVVTVRAKREGGGFWGTEEERLQLISHLTAQMNPSYLDLEMGTIKANDAWFRALPRGPRRIISWHDFEKTPDIEVLRAVRREASAYGGIAKIVTMARRAEDSMTVLKLYQDEKEKGHDGLIAFCMGAAGTASRILSFQLGSPLVYASLPGEPVAPGQLSIVTVNTLKLMMERGGE